ALPFVCRADVLVNYDSIHHPVLAEAGMVVSQNSTATRVGLDILQMGGNAVDASVAMGFALAVTLPRAGNIGGSGFALVYEREDQGLNAYDFRSAAPSEVNRDQLLDDEGKVDTQGFRQGPSSAAVPGTVSGLYTIWRESGSLPWKALVEPAIRLAEEGFVVTQDLSRALNTAASRLGPYEASVEQFTAENGSLEPGVLWRQPDLAWSLQQIAADGADAFYRGTIAARLVAAMEKDGGYIRAEDLKNYKTRKSPTVGTNYRGYSVQTMPPSSAGGITLLQMLNMLSQFEMTEYAQGSAKSLHLLAEVMKRAAANRRTHIGDPTFVDVPIAQYIDMATAKEMAAGIDRGVATPVTAIKPLKLSSSESSTLREKLGEAAPESIDTTHYSVVDQWGNAVAVTYTLGSSFGSGYVAPGTGILLDDQMKNFYWNQVDHPNRYQPGKRMISTMTPTMVFDEDGNLVLVTGTPGGGRIINVILQIIVNVIDYNLNIAAATQAPRIHQGWRTAPLALESWISRDTVTRLEAMGHEIDIQPTMGSTQSIRLHPEYQAGSADSRRPNASAAGLFFSDLQVRGVRTSAKE
ncbi:MAG: gamma-glutamyltransferase, partial [Pseudomonadota bacterium]